MPISTWIRDLFGIRKDVIDTKKSKLEITKLEAEERERDLITPATLDDVKKYDPNVQKLELEIERVRASQRRKLGVGALQRVVMLVMRDARRTGGFPGITAILPLLVIIVVIIVYIIALVLHLLR